MNDTQVKTRTDVGTDKPTEQKQRVFERSPVYIKIVYDDTDTRPFMYLVKYNCKYRKNGNCGYTIIIPGEVINVERDCLDKILIRSQKPKDNNIVLEGLFTSKIRAIREIERWKECVKNYLDKLEVE